MTKSPSMTILAKQYLEYRRNLGFQLRIEGQLLLGFAKYADRSGHRGPLTSALAIRWARLPRGADRLYWARRLEIVRCFARYRMGFDPRTEIPLVGIFGIRGSSTRRPAMKTAKSASSFSRLVQCFFCDRLVEQQNVSPRTVSAYRDSFRLLLSFLAKHYRKRPECLAVADLNAPVILAFLNHLEKERKNSVRT